MVSMHGKQVFLMLNVIKNIHPIHLPNNLERHHQLKRFFETPKVGIIGIFVLLKYENELEIVATDISLVIVKERCRVDYHI